MRNRWIGVSGLLLATFLYGFWPILARIASFNLPIFFQSWSRTLLEFIILSLPIILFKKWKTVKSKDIKWLLIRSIAGVIGFYGIYVAFIFIPIGTTYFVFYAGSTIGGYLIGKLLFKEKLDRIKIISLFLALLGLVFIYSINFELGKSLYIIFALISGLATSVWNIFPKKISTHYSALQLNYVDVIIFFLANFILSCLTREQWVAPSVSSVWIANLLFALIFILTGQLMIYGFKHIEAQTGSLIMLAEAVFGVLFGFIVYKEMVSLTTLLGGIAIITAIILPEVKRKKND